MSNSVKVFVPVPSDVYNGVFNPQYGTASYNASKEAIQWEINKLPGYNYYASY